MGFLSCDAQSLHRDNKENSGIGNLSNGVPPIYIHSTALEKLSDKDQPNTKLNHFKDPLEVPSGPSTRARANKLKEALTRLVQNVWSKMDLEKLGMPREHEGQPPIHLIKIQKKPNSCRSKG